MRTLLTTLHSKYIHPSLALPYLVAYCGEDCGDLLIEELTIHQPKENLLAQIVACKADVVCFSMYLWNRQLSLELITALKIAVPQVRIVVGGPDVSFEGAEFFERCPVDALICGEGEIPLKHLLSSWKDGVEPASCPGLQRPGMDSAAAGQSLLADLDLLPSPFAAGLVDLSRGYVYYESSRGCPYSCSFCMSALDNQVRSFSMARIFRDLDLLMQAKVDQIKFVDRTFNYHAERCREIIAYILQHNISSRFHFEVGADLLDEATLQLLETVPPGTFQFEIGVQTTSSATLERIGRKSSLEKLELNVKRLIAAGNISIHLDLIAGLPGEGVEDFFNSLQKVLALKAQHLQVELVKLLPGSPLRQQAGNLKIHFDSAPPYSVLRTPQLSFDGLEEIRRVGRLLDLVGNSGRFKHLLHASESSYLNIVEFYRHLQGWWQKAGLFEEPLGLRQIFDALHRFVEQSPEALLLSEALGRDFALVGRVVPGKAPAFFNCELSSEEEQRVKQRVKSELESLEDGWKLQHFAAIFETITPVASRSLLLYLYRSRSKTSPSVEEIIL